MADDVEVTPRGRCPTVAAWTLLASVCATSAVAGRLCFLGRPFSSDGAMFIYMGQLVAEGGRVGRELVDNKFPTVGLMTSAAWRPFGTAWPAYVVLGAALSGVAAAALGAAAGRAGRWPTVLFAVVFLNLTPVVYAGFQLETAIACFASLAAMAAVRAIGDGSTTAAFAAGLAAGCAALLKPTGAGVLGAMGVGLVARCLLPPAASQTGTAALALVRRSSAVGLAALAGLAVPLSVAAVYLSAADLWSVLPVTARRLAAYADGSVLDAGAGLKLATAAVILGFPFLVRAVPRKDGFGNCRRWTKAVLRYGPADAVASDGSGQHLLASSHQPCRGREDASDSGAVRANATTSSGRCRRYAEDPGLPVRDSGLRHTSDAGLQGRRAGSDSNRDLGTLAFALAWLAIEVAGVVAQRRMYAYHFLPIVPPAALLFGLMPRSARPWRLLASLGPAAGLSVCYALHVAATPDVDRLPVSDYLQARAVPGDRVWADDWPRLMLETGLRPGSRQALTFLFANDDATAGADSAQIVADLDAGRAAFVVLPADLPRWLRRQTSGIVELSTHPARATAYVAGWRRIERYTLAHYRREAVVGDAAVYRRVDQMSTADVR